MQDQVFEMYEIIQSLHSYHSCGAFDHYLHTTILAFKGEWHFLTSKCLEVAYFTGCNYLQSLLYSHVAYPIDIVVILFIWMCYLPVFHSF